MTSTIQETRASIAGLWREPRRIGLWALFLVAFAGLDRLSALFLPGVGALTPLDLAGGLAFGFLIAEGPAAAVLVALADFADDFLVPGARPPVHDLALAALATGVSYGLAAAWLRRGKTVRLAGERDLVRLAFAAALAALVHVGADFLLLGRWTFLAGESWRSALPSAWIGAFVGILIVAPLLILPKTLDWRFTRRGALEGALMGAVLMAVMGLIFATQSGDRFRFFYILFLPQIWVAVRFGVQGATLGNALVQVGLMSFLLARPHSHDMIFGYQARFLALVATILFLGCAVSERRGVEAALRQRQEELARISRLSLAGEMAAALAHQLNQPLMAVMAFARSTQRLLDHPDASSDRTAASQAIDETVAQAERAAAIVRSLREFIGRSTPSRAAIAYDQLLQQAALLVEPQCVRAGVRLEIAADHGLPDVCVDAGQVQQVLINLVQNAVDALAGLPGRRLIVLGARLAADGAVEAEVRDSGLGVAAAVEARLFEPFASDKPRGMGLGLTVCRGLVEAQGGRLWLAENLPGRCAFRFTLPTAQTLRRRP
jgi:signal transduction histidine kinase